MKTSLSWKRLVILSPGVALLGIPGYSSISEVLAVGTIPHSELFDGVGQVCQTALEGLTQRGNKDGANFSDDIPESP